MENALTTRHLDDFAGGYVQGSPFGENSPGTVKKATSHSLRPVTIKQLLASTQAHGDAEWMLGDCEINHITAITHVLNVQVNPTNNIYELGDGTGRIEARHWVDASTEGDEGKTNGVTSHMYARVTGTLKQFGTKKYLNVAHIQPVADPHELIFHLFEAVYVTLEYSRGPVGGGGEPMQGVTFGGSQSAYSHQNQGSGDQYSHMNDIERRIMQFLRSQQGGDGVHVAAIGRAIKADPPVVSDALDKLVEGGDVFITSDNHYAAI
ncbi:replication protein A, subunit RPA32 [Thelephora ganbajun]|uniref:Replication protein A, subunit RPA32 n=1 Tax=Thelephora ganbajun TaxID=370292 RepID=A0ACB6ZP28_THEGA|nr:replication protein A, subunit RPA32 [Thelephora ganbajun]